MCLNFIKFIEISLIRDVEGVSVEVRMYEKGQVFGELALLTGETRSATIIANEDSLLLELKKEPFQKLLNQYQVFLVSECTDINMTCQNLRAKLMVLVDSRKRIAHQTKQLLSSSST
jgi:CRP-like cAMP-binding protein